jgi:hypothetical protein
MNFAEQIVSTLIGTFAGFIFSIVLFYLTEKWRSQRTHKDLSSNIQRELQFNVDFLAAYKTEFEKMLRLITAQDAQQEKQIYTIFRHNKVQRLFLQEAFQKGLLYKSLTTDEINDVDAMLSYFLPYRDQLLSKLLTDYTTHQATGQVVLQTFEWDRDQLDKYLKFLNTLKTKLQGLK